jgi:hypothetical protein
MVYDDMIHEAMNLDIPGIDFFTEYHGIYFCWQPETFNSANNISTTSGRWVLTNNVKNPAIAHVAWYNGDYNRIDQAIEKFLQELKETK